MNGFVNILKPPGMTSHDVVSWIRKKLRQKKIGHTGTLDPGVAGVLPICLGTATRLAEYVSSRSKSYRGEITFGMSTDSQDAYGEVIQVKDCNNLSMEEFLKVLPKFTGEISQIPPMVSAVRVQGQRLYELARKGIVIERTPRYITVFQLEILKTHWQLPHPKAVFDVTCSSGTYVRTLCHDIGQELGVGAFLSFLVRTGSSDFEIAQAWTLEEITRLIDEGDFSFVLPPQKGIFFLPPVIVNQDEAKVVRHGNSIILREKEFISGQVVRIENEKGILLAVGRMITDKSGVPMIKPEKVLSSE